MKTQIFFETEDKVQIVGTFVMPETDVSGVALLLHMMPSTRVSYQQLQEDLAAGQVASLAIDLRGHGDSVRQVGNDTPLSYKDFMDEDHQRSALDVLAAFEYLSKMTGAKPEKTVLVGASIGANLALQLQASNPDIRVSILLSPGLDYRGIETFPLLSRLVADQQSVFAVSSEEDTYSKETVDKMAEAFSDRVEPKIVLGRAHGTDMFANSDLYAEIVERICNTSQHAA